MRHKLVSALAACILLLGGCGANDQAGSTEKAADEDKATIESLTGNSDRHDGMFTFFVDRDKGTVRMLIDKDQLGQEYVYVATVRDAPPITGQFRGNVGECASSAGS